MNSIHDFEKRYRQAVKKIERANPISQRNKDLILRHKDWLLSTKNLSKARMAKILHQLLNMAHWTGKDFDRMSKEDIERLLGVINEQDYVPFTKKEYKGFLKRFLNWLRETENYPVEVDWIKPEGSKIAKMKIPEEILTEGDVKDLITHTQNVRDKALIATLFNSGCRIGELLFVKVKHIVFQENHTARMFVDGKTGKRWILLISCVPYLQDWINRHPSKGNPDAYVWVKSNSELITYNMVRQMLADAGKRAKITKKVNPHAFRHASATFYANFLTEAQMKQYFGWKQASEMAGKIFRMGMLKYDKRASLKEVLGFIREK